MNVTPAVIPWDGQKITKPGVYSGIPLAAYHGDICAGPSISSSGLRTIEEQSLLHYYDTSYLNPDYEAPEQKTFYNLGSAIHHLIGGEAQFKEHFVVRPAEWADWRKNDAKAWRSQMILEGKQVLVPDDLDVIRGVARNLARDEIVKAGILNGLAEHSIFWTQDVVLDSGEVVTVWLKSRPDIIPTQSNMIVDLKTTTDASRATVARSIANYGYHMQLGLVHDGLKAVWGRQMEEHVLVFVETSRPYAINVKPLDYQDISYGRRQIKRSIRKFAQAVASGEWPGYEDSAETVYLPAWYRERLAKQAETGQLPPLDDQPTSDEAF